MAEKAKQAGAVTPIEAIMVSRGLVQLHPDVFKDAVVEPCIIPVAIASGAKTLGETDDIIDDERLSVVSPDDGVLSSYNTTRPWRGIRYGLTFVLEGNSDPVSVNTILDALEVVFESGDDLHAVPVSTMLRVQPGVFGNTQAAGQAAGITGCPTSGPPVKTHDVRKWEGNIRSRIYLRWMAAAGAGEVPTAVNGRLEVYGIFARVEKAEIENGADGDREPCKPMNLDPGAFHAYVEAKAKWAQAGKALSLLY